MYFIMASGSLSEAEKNGSTGGELVITGLSGKGIDHFGVSL